MLCEKHTHKQYNSHHCMKLNNTIKETLLTMHAEVKTFIIFFFCRKIKKSGPSLKAYTSKQILGCIPFRPLPICLLISLECHFTYK